MTPCIRCKYVRDLTALGDKIFRASVEMIDAKLRKVIVRFVLRTPVIFTKKPRGLHHPSHHVSKG